MAWVRVMGSIKSFSGKRHVTAIKIRPVTDFNEIYFHQLEALSVHLYYTKGPIGEAGAVGGGAYGIHGPNGPSAYSSGTTSTAPKDDGGLGPQYADLPQLHRQIVMFMKNSVDGDQGINVGAIARGVASSGVDAIAISYVSSFLVSVVSGLTCSPFVRRAAMDQLMDDGHIYATIDEVGYLVCIHLPSHLISYLLGTFCAVVIIVIKKSHPYLPFFVNVMYNTPSHQNESTSLLGAREDSQRLNTRTTRTVFQIRQKDEFVHEEHRIHDMKSEVRQ